MTKELFVYALKRAFTRSGSSLPEPSPFFNKICAKRLVLGRRATQIILNVVLLKDYFFAPHFDQGKLKR